MSLENELKKNTAAVEANTAAIKVAYGAPVDVKIAAVANGAPAPVIPVAGPGAIVTPLQTPSILPAAGPGLVQPPQQTAQPIVPHPTPPPAHAVLTHQQAQAELSMICQQLGAPDQVQAIMLQYSNARLDAIPVENLFSLVQACKALLPI